MNVLIIPEDFRKDQYILKPIVQAMLADLGKPRAKIRVMTDPLLGGLASTLDVEILRNEVVARYRGMVHLFLLLVDRDANPTRRESLMRIEKELNAVLSGRCLLAELAYQEIEVWALAGGHVPIGEPWATVRGEAHPKEKYFEPAVRELDLEYEPGQGRDTLGGLAARSLQRVMKLCPELAHLSARIAAFLKAEHTGEPYDE
jgi:hypothetical protein